MAVAKSYEKFPLTCDPFVENGKWYVKIDKGNDTIRKVRWYSDKEYAKMYPEAQVISDKKNSPYFKTQKEVLGFGEEGYIIAFKGDTYSHLAWFHDSICQYNRWWGWYLHENESIPEDLPKDLIPVKLYWDAMSDDGENLSKQETKVQNYIDSIRYDPGVSNFVGTKKERLSLTLKVKRVVPLEGAYGSSSMHIFEDESKNEFVWITAAKTLVEGLTYKLRGTVKDHKIYHGVKQTILTRCLIQD